MIEIADEPCNGVVEIVIVDGKLKVTFVVNYDPGQPFPGSSYQFGESRESNSHIQGLGLLDNIKDAFIDGIKTILSWTCLYRFKQPSKILSGETTHTIWEI